MKDFINVGFAFCLPMLKSRSVATRKPVVWRNATHCAGLRPLILIPAGNAQTAKRSNKDGTPSAAHVEVSQQSIGSARQSL